jgi:hypothetical protein
MALRWPAENAHAGFAGAIAAVVAFGVLAIGFAALALRPAIEIHETHLLIRGVAGLRTIPWEQIRHVDQVSWRWQIRWLKDEKVLAVILALDGGDRLLVVHAGGFDSGRSLLRHLRRCAREALLDGIPYRQFWGQGEPEHPQAERLRSEHPRSEQTRPEGALPESTNLERGNSERTPLRSRLGDAEHDARHRGSPPAAPFKYPLLLAEDEAEIEHMFECLKSAGRLDPQNRDTRGDASLDPRASGEGQG